MGAEVEEELSVREALPDPVGRVYRHG